MAFSLDPQNKIVLPYATMKFLVPGYHSVTWKKTVLHTGKSLSEALFSLWPVWDIFVQNQYAGKNGLNGLLCYQNHH